VPTAAISYGAYKRTGNPEFAALNCYAEQYPTAAGPAIQMRARPGIELFETVGSGAFRSAMQKDGLFASAAVIVNGTTAYTVTDGGVVTPMAGTIAGNGILDADMGQDADLESVARWATGSALYKGTLGSVTLEDFPDVGGAGASSVCYHRGFWFAVEAGTDKVYVQIPGDLTWDPLTFSSAEYAPDPLVAVRSRGDQIALMGSSTFEVFVLSGTASDPIVPYGGLNFDHGCRSALTAVNCKGSLLYVDNECNVRRWDGGEPRIISDPGLTEQIAAVAAADLRAWTYAADGHRFYVLTLGGDSTWVYDLTGGGERWSTFNSLGYDYWRMHLGCSIGNTVLACDNLSAQLYRLDPTRKTDGTDVFQKKFCAVIDGQDTTVSCSNLVVVCDIGDAPMEGQGSTPIMQLRLSTNQGKTFGPIWESEFAGTGDYATLPRWNGLGDVPPLLGMIFEFSMSDPVGSVFKRVAINVE
jgi:hypothetical protein